MLVANKYYYAFLLTTLALFLLAESTQLIHAASNCDVIFRDSGIFAADVTSYLRTISFLHSEVTLCKHAMRRLLN